MKNMKIEDVCTFVGGSQPPKSMFKYSPQEGYVRLIQTRDYKTDRFITYIPLSEAKKTCTTEDVMIGRYGPPIFQILRGLEGAYNVALMKACPKDIILNDYLYYLLKQKNLFLYIDALSSRTGGQTGVDIQSLNKYPVLLPTKEYQQKVVEILKGLDDKIRINKQIRDKLEGMMWEMWQYKFANKINQHPTKKLSEFCVNSTESIEPTKTSVEYAYYNIPDFDATGAYVLEKGSNIKSNKYLVHKNDILISKLNPWFNRVVLADRDAICSTEFVVIRTDNVYLRNFLYVVAISEPFINYCSSNATGTSNSHKRITPDLMLEFEVNCNVVQAKKFGEEINSMIDTITNIVNQNLLLSTIRDFLLPMLMNGQVTVE